MERDVVCGMQVDPAKARWTSEHDGRTYYFCGKGCKEKFEADPQRYLKPEFRIPNPESRIPAGSIEYTCPMHPEVRQLGPGSCPICGMALEPATITAEPVDDSSLRDMTRRF